MARPKPKVHERVFEARYERGYRYLDRCGDAMLVLEDVLTAETGKVWMPEDMTPKGAKLKCPELDLEVFFDTSRLAVIQQSYRRRSWHHRSGGAQHDLGPLRAANPCQARQPPCPYLAHRFS